jgi:hypothetical protein
VPFLQSGVELKTSTRFVLALVVFAGCVSKGPGAVERAPGTPLPSLECPGVELGPRATLADTAVHSLPEVGSEHCEVLKQLGVPNSYLKMVNEDPAAPLEFGYCYRTSLREEDPKACLVFHQTEGEWRLNRITGAPSSRNGT